MDNVRSNHLEELKASDFQIMDGMPDIQGWRIEDFQGEKVGKVRDMLFDKEKRKVRYIITKLEGDNQEVLIPIGKVQLEVNESKIIVKELTIGGLASLPTYIKDNLTSDDERAILNVFRRQQVEGIAQTNDDPVYNHDTFYDNESFDQNRFYPNLGEEETSTSLTGNQNPGIIDDIDPTDDLDRTDWIKERRNRLGDDGPIDRDINNPLIH